MAWASGHELLVADEIKPAEAKVRHSHRVQRLGIRRILSLSWWLRRLCVWVLQLWPLKTSPYVRNPGQERIRHELQDFPVELAQVQHAARMLVIEKGDFISGPRTHRKKVSRIIGQSLIDRIDPKWWVNWVERQKQWAQERGPPKGNLLCHSGCSSEDDAKHLDVLRVIYRNLVGFGKRTSWIIRARFKKRKKKRYGKHKRTGATLSC